MALTQKELKHFLHYDPDTGDFIWKNPTNCSIKIGQIAGTETQYGYISITLNKKLIMAHRLAFLYMEGYFPENDIDHINRVKNDNRWINLRHVSRSCNRHNSDPPKNNKSGITGVSWYKLTKRWMVNITVNKNRIFLGYYKSLTKAVHARWKEEKKHNFINCNSTSSAYLYLKNKGLVK